MQLEIALYVNDGIAYVWNSDDWYALRSKHRICGSLVGSVPSFPRQNDFLGLPMALMSEEAALLMEKGICGLYEMPNITHKPLDDEREAIKTTEQNILEEQIEALRKRKIEQLSQKIDIIVAGKKQKLLSKGITDINMDKEAMLEEEINKLPKLASGHVLVHLPTEHFMDTEKRKVGLDVLSPNVLEGDGAKKYCIFKNMWEQGYYITNGSKFGSDYLLYLGDPVKFHATYMVRCVGDKTSFSPTSLVSYGRLSVAVNKLALLAYYNTYGKIEYQTLQWHDSVNV